MKCILSKNIALRSYRDYRYRLIKYHNPRGEGISREEFDFLLLCDGKNDIPKGEYEDLVSEFYRRKIIREAGAGEELTPWQRDIYHDNNYIPNINLQVTGKCNFNCLHCFNAKDNERLNTELSLSQVIKILDQAKECGVLGFTITGGEPMIHRDIAAIFDAVYERGMHVFEFNTNGMLITRDFLDHLKKIKSRPLIKISFDGLGFHDWIRDFKGAEERTLDAVRLCVENGFRVNIQTQMTRKNLESLPVTIKLMEELGVYGIRFIRTTESSRWEENAGDACLSFPEYYEACYGIIKDYMEGDHDMMLTFWQVLEYYPKTRKLEIGPDRCRGDYKSSRYICSTIRQMMAISSGGNLYPCLQSSGTLDSHGINYGNIFETPMREFLQGSRYFDLINYKTDARRHHNEKCMKCEYFDMCCGGCPALGFLSSGGDILGVDKSKCLFFEGGYYDRFMGLI